MRLGKKKSSREFPSHFDIKQASTTIQEGCEAITQLSANSRPRLKKKMENR